MSATAKATAAFDASHFDDQIYSSKFLMRNQIIRTAEEIAKRKGFAETTVKDICEAVGISRQTFYRHFENKAHLSCWLVANIIYKHFSRIGASYSWEQALGAIWLECGTAQTDMINMGAKEVAFEKVFDMQRHCIEDLLTGLLRSRGIMLGRLLRLEVNLYSITMASTFLCSAYDEQWHDVSPDDLGILFAQVVPTELKEALLNS